MAGDFDENLAALEDRLIAAIPVAFVRGLEHIRSVATPLVPHQTGHLAGEADITVTNAVGDQGMAVGEIYYPGPYARYQHYELQLRHPLGGQALYLEQPMLTEADAVIKIVSDTLGEAF